MALEWCGGGGARTGGTAASRALALGAFVVALGACELDVALPHVLTDDVLEGPETAELQVHSAIALFECAASAFAWVALPFEDVVEPTVAASRSIQYRSTPDFPPTPSSTPPCDVTSLDGRWYDPMMGARAMLSRADGRGVYDRLQNEWSLGAQGERLSAIAAIYMAAALDHFGEFYCEMALDVGPLLTPDEVLALAEEWITVRALAHIDNVGDFAMPFGIASSARHMAIALRARIRWARGDLAGAASDAAAVPPDFTAWITRETGPERRNKIYDAATAVGYHGMLGVNDWWTSTISLNPATGQPWPGPIPFTGYIFLGVMPDGRAVDDGGYPIRWAEEVRNLGDLPTSLGNGAVPDTRVEHLKKIILGSAPREVPTRYGAEDDDIPLVGWKEMWLIRAEAAGGQTAIDLVNELRADEGLPPVTYMTGATATAQQIRYMILEERRRSLFAEGGRYWSTKIRNTDVLWFPRADGEYPALGLALEGGVRLLMPASEYANNPHVLELGGRDARGTGCDPAEAPAFN